VLKSNPVVVLKTSHPGRISREVVSTMRTATSPGLWPLGVLESREEHQQFSGRR
jgi:hypothetical protein